MTVNRDTDASSGAAQQAMTSWNDAVVPLLMEYGRIPNLSPAYDSEWETHGELDRAADLFAEWARSRELPGAMVEVVRIDGLSPTVVIDVPATDPEASGTVLVYGHYDKQPPFVGWTHGRGPWQPTLDGDYLYGRGMADDGYAMPSALVALEAIRSTGGCHARCLVLIEGSEESGSPHLPQVLAALADRIGSPDLVLALDSGSPTGDRLWVTTSLRGSVVGTLTVEVLDHGVHSGSAGAVVPSSFRIARYLLDRVEDSATGALLLPELVTEPSAGASTGAEQMARAMAESGLDQVPFPIVDSLVLQGDTVAARALRTAWLGSVAVVGADGLPPTIDAGAVLLPSTALKLVIRIPPNADAIAAEAAVAKAVTSDSPHGARVTWQSEQSADGWVAPPIARWLTDALDRSSLAAFGRPAAQVGEGGTIPFLGWLAARFPTAQILALGVLVPGSNHHGPDESLHLPTAERVTGAVAALLVEHASRSESMPRPHR